MSARRRASLAIGLALTLTICDAPSSRPFARLTEPSVAVASAGPAEQPVGGGGSTADPFDWEKVPAREPRDSYPVPPIESSKTLEQTTKWLRWALERYGAGVRPTAYRSDIRDVRFRECAMEWTFHEEIGGGLARLQHYEMNLGTVTGARGFRGETRIDLSQPPRIKERILEKGKDKPSTPLSRTSVQLPLRNEDHISSRVSWAIRHASRLCRTNTR